MVLGYVAGAGGALGVPLTRTVATLLDSKKGSLTNRAQCAKEHMNNDLNLGLKLSVPAAAGVVAVCKPDLATKLAAKAGNYITYGVKEAVKLFSKGGAKGQIAKAIGYMAKHPTRTGVAGLALTAGLWVLNSIVNHANKNGRINQKYEDAARIESQTKNVVLENPAYKNQVMEFYKNGGRGIY
ncbi:hypothetical protein IJ541_03380 [bacterium]|nr:hypothetical protein [bacterium]